MSVRWCERNTWRGTAVQQPSSFDLHCRDDSDRNQFLLQQHNMVSCHFKVKGLQVQTVFNLHIFTSNHILSFWEDKALLCVGPECFFNRRSEPQRTARSKPPGSDTADWSIRTPSETFLKFFSREHEVRQRDSELLKYFTDKWDVEQL